jgi:murein L,D-transpeptidase YafK
MTSKTKLLINIGFFSFFLLNSFNNYASFLDDQLKFSRVKQAYLEKKPIITEKLQFMDLEMNDFEVMIKVYKYEQKVKIYVKKKAEARWREYKSYPFNCTSGELGPKRAQGDYQIPEGYYHIMHFNPYSNFFLSLGVSYPNKADKLNSDAHDKGGAIYMHGGCATIGCIPIEDGPIKEVYIMSVLGKDNGQSRVPIHIFPFEYSDAKMSTAIKNFPEHQLFWENIYEIEKRFDSTNIVPSVGINNDGYYQINN